MTLKCEHLLKGAPDNEKTMMQLSGFTLCMVGVATLAAVSFTLADRARAQIKQEPWVIRPDPVPQTCLEVEREGNRITAIHVRIDACAQHDVSVSL